MSHTCSGLLMHCIDFRFQEEIKKFMEDHNLMNDCDVVSIAGSVKNILDESSRAFILKQIDISKRLHHMKEVHLMNHMDCGAYGGASAFANKEAESAHQKNELQKAAIVIQQSHPDLSIKLWIANIEEMDLERKIVFEEVV